MALPRVSIIGCGWLGLPLGVRLVRNGYTVKGSTTSLDKIPVLEQAGIFPFRVTVPSAGDIVSDGDFAEFFDTDILVITLPFKRDFAHPEEYRRQVSALLSHAQRGQSVVFTSSTSVYPDGIGEAREDTVFAPDTARARVLFAVEQDVLGFGEKRSVVVRLAGLYGGARRIGEFLASRGAVAGGDSPVNLLHQDDAVGVMAAVISRMDIAAGQIFNACADRHPTRRDLYTAAAIKLGLPPPVFENTPSLKQKIVINEKMKKVLGYELLHPDPMADAGRG